MAHFPDIAPYLQDCLDSLNMQSMAAHGWCPGGTQRLDVVIASVDRGMLHRWYPAPASGGGWHPRWEARGGAYASRAAVVNSRDDTLMAFALALTGDLTLTGVFGGNLDAVDAGNWPRENLGHPDNDRLVSRPTAITDADVVRVYARGESGVISSIVVDHNGNVVEKWHRASLGTPPRTGDRWIYAPAAASWGPGRVDLFSIAQGSELASDDNTLWHGWHEGNADGPGWEELGIAGLSSSPDAAVWAPTEGHPLGIIHVTAGGFVGDTHGPSFAFASWSDRRWAYRWLHPRGATVDGAIASWGRPRLDLFYIKDSFTRRPNGSERFLSGHACYDGAGCGPETAWQFNDSDFEQDYPVAPWNGRIL